MNNSEWTTKEGVKIKVCDMTDNHILAVIRMLHRQHDLICYKQMVPFGWDIDGSAEDAFAEFCDTPEASFPILNEMYSVLSERNVRWE